MQPFSWSRAALSFSVVFNSLSPSYGVLLTTNPNDVHNRTFDYIIIGGGTAGLTVASRLTESSNVSVLVVEAGQDDRDNPLVYDALNFVAATQSSLSWAYTTDQGRSITAGKTLGGSSSINGATYTRGLAAQYDAWSELLSPEDQNLQWNWDSLFGYMKKSEDFKPPNAAQEELGASSIPSVHGRSGPVQTTFPSTTPQYMFSGPQQTYFATVMTELGLNRGQDVCGGDPTGVTFVPNTVQWSNTTLRSSSAVSYLAPVQSKRPNWSILLGYQATKVLFATPKSSTGLKRAVGIQFGAVNGTSLYTASAAREVIVSAGAIGSPAILQHSGVGNKAALSKLGIQSVVDLPSVGLNLQEQTQTVAYANATDFDIGGLGPNDVIGFPNLEQLYGANASLIAKYIQSSYPNWAESQAGSALSASALKKIYQIQANIITQQKAPVVELFYSSSPGYPPVVVEAWQLLPFSRGNISIVSADPFVKPQVNVNYFSVEADMLMQVQGMRLARQALQTPPLSSLSYGEVYPGFDAVPDDANYGTVQDWSTWTEANFYPVSHPIGSCAMMAKELGGVVDGHLRVYGTENLRVVDASVFPLQISAHLSATVYGVAEKAADLIKLEW